MAQTIKRVFVAVLSNYTEYAPTKGKPKAILSEKAISSIQEVLAEYGLKVVVK